MRSRRGDRSGRRRGFTLIELMAALMLTGLALLGAYRLLDQLADGPGRLRTMSIDDASRANRSQFLRDVIAHAELGSDSSQRFVGSATSASFASWCLAPGGWLERCAVSLEIHAGNDSSVVAATLGGASLTLWHGRGKASLSYFETGRGWLREWSSSLTVPSAVGVVVAADTLVLPVGGTP